jgi:hypothetical protein
VPPVRALLVGAMALLGVALAPGRANAGTTAPSCVPATLSVSQALAGGAVTVSPAPDSTDASYLTQISFLGVPVTEITDIAVVGSHSGAHAGRLAAYSQGDGASFQPSKPFFGGEVVTVHAMLPTCNRRPSRSAPTRAHIPLATSSWRPTPARASTGR